MNKESLIAENATLKAKVEELQASDRNLREKLSDALGAGTYKEHSYSDPKPVVYSWFTIFRELGKLLERKDQSELQEELRCAIERCYEIEPRVWKLENPGKEPEHCFYDKNMRRTYYPKP